MTTSQDIVEGLAKALEDIKLRTDDFTHGDDLLRMQIRGINDLAAGALAAYRASPQNDGWNEWKGGECPVEPDTLVDLKFHCGDIQHLTRAKGWRWTSSNYEYDIIAWRLAK